MYLPYEERRSYVESTASFSTVAAEVLGAFSAI